MKKLTDEEINTQYEVLMQFECVTISRDAAIMLLDEVICSRSKDKLSFLSLNSPPEVSE